MEPEGYYEKYFDAKLESIKVRIASMDKALELQAREIERRLEALNELREEFTRDRGQFALKKDMQANFKQVDKLETRTSILETRIVIYGVVLAFVFALIQVALRFLK